MSTFFKNGVDIGEEKLVRPADLVILGCKADVSEITLTITEGKFHQVKRMFEAVGKKGTVFEADFHGTIGAAGGSCTGSVPETDRGKSLPR